MPTRRCAWCHALIPPGYHGTVNCPIHEVQAFRLAAATLTLIRTLPTSLGAAEPESEPVWETLPPAEKVRIVEAMGFTRCGSDHQPDCPASLAPGEYRCQCVRPPDEYGLPPDVATHLGQDWETLRAARRRG